MFYCIAACMQYKIIFLAVNMYDAYFLVFFFVLLIHFILNNKVPWNTFSKKTGTNQIYFREFLYFLNNAENKHG